MSETKRDDGGPAFPYSALAPEGERGVVGSLYKDNEGMSLRDYFAGHALVGVYAGRCHHDVAKAIADESMMQDLNLSPIAIGHLSEARIADMVYAMADAMLKARTQ